MKTLKFVPLLLLALFLAGKSYSQLSLVVFSDDGTKFTLYVNNDPKNSKPAGRVDTDRPGGPTFKLRVLFEDSNIPEVSKTIFNSPGPDMFYVLRKSGNGKYVMEKTSSVYGPAATAAAAAGTEAKKEEAPKAEEPKTEAKPASTAAKGCSNPMPEPDFIASREMISNAPFDPPKLSHAKSLADKHCLTTDQIIETIYLFSGESSKLSFAKYAYKHCWDPQNYERVKDVLRASSREDLQRYIDTEK